METSYLGPEHEETVRTLLCRDPLMNIFLLSQLEYIGSHWNMWRGIWEDDLLQGVCFNWQGMVTVPYFTDSVYAEVFGETLRAQDLGMVIGPRSTCDVLTRACPGWRPVNQMNQLLMKCAREVEGLDLAEVEQATLMDVPQLAELGIQMSLEDLGLNPSRPDASIYVDHVRTRVEEGRTWVVREGYDIVFMVHVGASHDGIAQLSGTWTAPNRRGQGIASKATATIVNDLLKSHRTVILDVNETNIPAMRVYSKIGFRYHAPMRIYTHRDDRSGA